ncbi:hypothetical protein FQA47_013177 [Oryzias melastigma]|uniref:Uncharacterized protein n=1 Tax=Oryzias melastigma TaxID=30732 RepID=A0A834KX69_ORYME|nr:hypothetical protein FQA47_013177 [Oryzias melastigma]
MARSINHAHKTIVGAAPLPVGVFLQKSPDDGADRGGGSRHPSVNPERGEQTPPNNEEERRKEKSESSRFPLTASSKLVKIQKQVTVNFLMCALCLQALVVPPSVKLSALFLTSGARRRGAVTQNPLLPPFMDGHKPWRRGDPITLCVGGAGQEKEASGLRMPEQFFFSLNPAEYPGPPAELPHIQNQSDGNVTSFRSLKELKTFSWM